MANVRLNPMANLSYLFASNAEGVPLYERDVVIATGRYLIPAFWLASTVSKNIKHIVDEEGDELPYLDIEVEQAISQFNKNKNILVEMCSGFESYFKSWSSLLTSINQKSIKIDPTEIIFIVNTDHNRFYKAIELFENPNSENMNAFLDLTCISDIVDKNKNLKEKEIIGDMDISPKPSDYLLGCLDK